MAYATLFLLGFVSESTLVICLFDFSIDLTGLVAEGGASVSFVNRSISLPPIHRLPEIL